MHTDSLDIKMLSIIIIYIAKSYSTWLVYRKFKDGFICKQTNKILFATKNIIPLNLK